MRYRKNILQQEYINRHGQTAGLPLFKNDDANRAIPESTKVKMANAPKAVALATDTQKLAHMLLKYDKVRLNNVQWEILDTLIFHENLTNTEIAKLLKRPINTVTPRVYELRGLGIAGQPFVIFAEKRVCTITKMVVTAWKFNPKIPTTGLVEDVDKANMEAQEQKSEDSSPQGGRQESE